MEVTWDSSKTGMVWKVDLTRFKFIVAISYPLFSSRVRSTKKLIGGYPKNSLIELVYY